ncbi:hypothetical protein EVC30_136 [Rhizobium phage RHph_Y1_11]|nr:hypothetical protein EVC30_136 [Rhizobium phage RHph_Y1_11]
MKFKFYSDANFTAFKELLEHHNIEYLVPEWDTIEVLYAPREIAEEAYSLGATECNN